MQTVNLYLDEFKPTPIRLPLSQMTLVLTALVFVLGLTSISIYREATVISHHHAELSHKKSELETTSEKLRALHSTVADQSLQNTNTKLSKAIVDKQLTYQHLSALAIASQQPYSDAMITLATTKHSGVWLSAINIKGQQAKLSVVGHAAEPAQVSAWMASIKPNNAFKQHAFDNFEIAQVVNEAGKELMNFSLGSSAEPKKIANQNFTLNNIASNR